MLVENQLDGLWGVLKLTDYACLFSSNEELWSDEVRRIVSALGDGKGEVYAREIPNTTEGRNQENGAAGVLDSLGDTERAVRFVTIAKMATLPSDEASDVGNLVHFVLD